MMEEKEIACFTVRVTSTDDGTWQGTVETKEKCFLFQSEMQLLKWLREQYPALLPDTTFQVVSGPEK